MSIQCATFKELLSEEVSLVSHFKSKLKYFFDCVIIKCGPILLFFYFFFRVSSLGQILTTVKIKTKISVP